MILSNTFVTSSSSILLLLTIDYYLLTVTVHHQPWPAVTSVDKEAVKSDHSDQGHHQEQETAGGVTQKPLLRVFLAIVCSFLMNLPRGLEFTIEEQCVGMMINTSSCICDSLGLCQYNASERNNVVRSFPWITYILSSEIGLKLLPSVVLATLNWKLINW